MPIKLKLKYNQTESVPKKYTTELTINKNNSRQTCNMINDLTKENLNKNNSHINALYAGSFIEYFS